ncbi:hypothetical protein [Methanosarcina horonobensis]|nr:hypothetical protein [Methanosarcina horonobensis]
MLGATQEQIGLTALTYTDSQMQQAIKVIDRNNRQAITTAITGIFDEKYMGGMEALSKSAKGIWSNIWDSLYKGQLAFMGFDEATKQFREGSLFDRMKTGLGGVLDTVQNIDFEKAGQGVETFLGWMDKGKEILQPWTDAEKRINKAVFGILKDVKNALGTEITGDLDGLKLLLQDLYGAFVLLRRGAAYVFEYIDSHDIGGKFVLSFRLALESISAVYSWIHDKLVWALDEIITRYNSLVPLLQKAGIDAEVVSMDMFKPVKDSAKDAREEVKKEMDQVVADHRAAVDEMTGAAKGAEIIPGGRRSYAQIMGVDAAKAAGLSGVYGSMGIPAAKVSQTSTIPAADTEVTSTRITAIQSPTNIGFNLTSLITGIKDEFVAALKQEPRDVEINMNVVVRNESSMRNLQKQIGEATARGVSGKYTYS